MTQQFHCVAVSEELLKCAQGIMLKDIIVMVFVEIVSSSFSRGFFFLKEGRL